MKTILVRNLDEQVLAALKRLAASNHRSLQGELLHLLTRASRLAPGEEEISSLELFTVSTGRRTTFDREEIYGDDGR
jgi:plasmid stability protein